MSNPRYSWWGYALKMVKDYPMLCATEDLSHDDLRERNAVQAAIDATLQMEQGERRVKLIRSVYWGRRKQTIKDVSAQLNIEPTVADRWHSAFIRQVGKCWGFDVG